MGVELPKDAEGREIPLDTVALFNRDGNVYSIVRWTFTTDFDLSDGWSNKWRAITDRGFALDPALVYLTTPDTWEKLEEDLGRGADALNYEACAYFGKSACDCSSCIADKGGTCERIVMRDIADRIRKLRGEGEWSLTNGDARSRRNFENSRRTAITSTSSSRPTPLGSGAARPRRASIPTAS